MKGIKGKILAGAVSVSILLGSGLVLANTDAGAQLKAWYNAKLQASFTTIYNTLYAYAESLVPGLLEYKNNLKKDAVDAIKTEAQTVITNSNSKIDSALQEHLDSLNAAKEEILNGMESDYTTWKEEKIAWAEPQLNQLQSDVQNEINTAITNQYTTSKYEVTTQVTATKNSAVASLENAINEAKNAITGEMNTNEANTINDLKTYLDDQVATRKATITEATNTLKAEKIEDIKKEGTIIVEEAKAALDALVSGINK